MSCERRTDELPCGWCAGVPASLRTISNLHHVMCLRLYIYTTPRRSIRISALHCNDDDDDDTQVSVALLM